MSSALEKMLARTGKTEAGFRSRKASGTKLGKIFRRRGVAKTKELERIAYLPRRRWQDDPELEQMRVALTDWLRLNGGTQELRLVQAAALQELHDYGGMFGCQRVGAGKTLTSFLASIVVGAVRPLLLIPGKLVRKTEREFKELARHWLKHPNLLIMSYELLSRDRGSHELIRIAPDLIICDEVHHVKNKDAGCTRKIRRWMREHPETKFVGMSGTITTRSIGEYEHILRWCIPNHAPLPRQWGEVQDWSDALDVKVQPQHRLAPGALLQFCNDEEILQAAFGGEQATDAARKGYRRRLTETPGVVATEEGFLGASIQIIGLDVELGKSTAEAFRRLREDWQTPDGWDFTEAVDLWRHAREIACGLFYRWWDQERFSKCLIKMLKPTMLIKGLKGRPIRKQLAPESSHIVEKRERPIQEQLAPEIVYIVKKILNDSVNGIENAIDLEKELEIRGFEKGIRSQGISKTDTALHLKSIKNSTTGLMADAIFAGRKGDQVNHGKVLDGKMYPEDLLLITIIRQAEYEDYCALSATERWAIWETLLSHYPALLRILKESFNAARAPKDWMEARRAWKSFAREMLKGNRQGIDTEDQVARACRAGRLDSEALDAWTEIRNTFKPNSVPVWIDDAMVRAAEKWLREGPGLCWVEHVAFGQRLSEESGVPYFAAKGLAADGTFVEDYSGPAIVSIEANKEGRNLQHTWSRNLIVSCPTSGGVFEQLAGRTHREGQEADEVTFDISLACREQWSAFAQAQADAKYIEHTTGQAQKLLYADVDMPTAEEVKARGLIDSAWSE